MGLWKKLGKASKTLMSRLGFSKDVDKEAAPAQTSTVDSFSSVEKAAAVSSQYEDCKTSIDTSLAQLAAEQAKLDDAFLTSVRLTRGLQEQSKRHSERLGKSVRDAS